MSFANVKGAAFHCRSCGEIAFAELLNGPRFLQVSDPVVWEMSDDARKFNLSPEWIHFKDGFLCDACLKREFDEDAIASGEKMTKWRTLKNQEQLLYDQARNKIIEELAKSAESFIESADPTVVDSEFIASVLKDRDSSNPKRVEKLIKKRIRDNADNYNDLFFQARDATAIQAIIDEYAAKVDALNQENEGLIKEMEEIASARESIPYEIAPNQRVEFNPYIHTSNTGGVLGGKFINSNGDNKKIYQLIDTPAAEEIPIGKRKIDIEDLRGRNNALYEYREKLKAAVENALKNKGK